MIEKFKNNYALSVWLVRLAYVFTFAFAHWFDTESALNLLSITGQSFPKNFFIILAFGIVSGAMSLLILYLVIRIIMYFAKIFTIPLNEMFFLTTMYLCLTNLILGCLNLTYYITPVITVWGSILYNFVAVLPSAILLFMSVKKHYLNDKNTVYVFTVFGVVFFAYFALILISALRGAII